MATDSRTARPFGWMRQRLGLILHVGKDKNGDGKYDPKGADGVLGTDDDEFDSDNPASIRSAPPYWRRIKIGTIFPTLLRTLRLKSARP